MASGRIVDSDSHILEPADLWEKNLEPKYRSRALGIRRDAKGLEYLSVDGKMSCAFRDGGAVDVGFIGKSQEWVKEHADGTQSQTRGKDPWLVYIEGYVGDSRRVNKRERELTLLNQTPTGRRRLRELIHSFRAPLRLLDLEV